MYFSKYDFKDFHFEREKIFSYGAVLKISGLKYGRTKISVTKSVSNYILQIKF